MSDSPRIELRFDDLSSLERDVASNLSKGRAFVMGAGGLELFSSCELCVVHPDDGRELLLWAEVVMPPEQQVALGGVGLELRDISALEAFLRAPEPEPEPAPDRPSRAAPPLNAQERVRKLKLTEQVKLARRADLADRVALERAFGKNVWEALLRNPKLTVAEVSRIARKGTVPRPLLELIVGTPTWLQSSIVRRALLQNTRLTRDSLQKVLRATPKAELKLVAKMTAYPAQVRELANKLLPP